MPDTFRIYKGSDVVAEGESPLEITGLEPETDVTKGEYKVVRVVGVVESKKVSVPSFTTESEDE